jgi:hypothetical protein
LFAPSQHVDQSERQQSDSKSVIIRQASVWRREHSSR